MCNDGTRHQLAFSQTKAVTAAGGGAHVVLLVVPHELERNGTETAVVRWWCVLPRDNESERKSTACRASYMYPVNTASCSIHRLVNLIGMWPVGFHC